MEKLSVVIITFNEEKNIGRCIDSVKDIADEIVVLDSFSADATASVCKKHEVRFIQRKWEGYSASKNAANRMAGYDWILSLDADEALSDELKRSIGSLKQVADKPQAAKFDRKTCYCGTWIRHGGWYPDTKIRMFDRRIAHWEGAIHETLIFSEPVRVIHLRGDCLHYSYYTVEDHLAQIENFTTLASKDLFLKKRKSTPEKRWLSPVAKFITDYFFKLGFLDGRAGYRIAKLSAYATYLKYKKLNKLYKNSVLEKNIKN
jgi:glycosyltransferase involved in cell wall biosynthesis